MVCLEIVLVLVLWVLIADSQQNAVGNFNSPQNVSVIRNNDFIEAHRRRFYFNNWWYDKQIEFFSKAYTENLHTIELQREYLTNELLKVDEHLYPLTLLSDFSKACVQKYVDLIPSSSWCNSQMDNCLALPRSQSSYIVSNLVNNNRRLHTYYITTFEKDIMACRNKFNASLATNYTSCLHNVVAVTNAFTQSNQKLFSSLLDIAKNTALTHYKNAQACTFGVHNTTLTRIAEATTNIDRCLRVMDDCSVCSGNYCKDVYNIPLALINAKNLTMINPLYGRNNTGNCLMLNIL